MRRLVYLLVFACLVSNSANAQSVANYAVTRSTGISFGSIASSGNAVDTWRNTGGFSQDDNRSVFVPIGFDFWYDGTRYTELSISTNGFIDFSSSTDDGGPVGDAFGFANAAFSQSVATLSTRPALAVFYDDLMAQGGTNPLGNSIRYQLSGTSPNRVFTVQWTNMAIYGNTSPSLNFQVKLYETTGVIEYWYGTMNAGTNVFSYTCGINAPTINAAPTAAQLKTQQAANSTTFSNTPQNNLSTMPTTNSRITFTPPVPANPGAGLSFTAVTQTSMTVNWANWAANEVGYAVYYSYDGTNYFFATQTAANATSANITGLWPGTTYQWRVMAVTEGAVSNAATGTQATSAAGTKLSNTINGNWNNPASWTPVGVPTAGDNVTIQNGHTITVNVTTSASPAVCNNLTVGQGTSGALVMGVNTGAPCYLQVNGNLTVAANGQVRVLTTSNNQYNTITVGGRIINNGSFDMLSDANSFCDINFSRNSSTSFSGTGTMTRVFRILMNIGTSNADRLDVTASNLSFNNNFLVLNSGTFHYSGTQTFSAVISSTDFTIGTKTGIWSEGTNATFSFSNNLTLEGLLRITGGTLNVGNAGDEVLLSNGGTLTIDGGAVNIAGRYYNTNQNTLSKFNLSSGNLNVPTVSSTSTTLAPFMINSPGAQFTMSGGTITILREGGSGAQDLGYQVTDLTSFSVTGGTLQIGTAATPASSTMRINTVAPIGNLVVNAPSSTAQLVTNPLTVVSNVTVTSGTLNANNLNISLGGNWNDQGTFVPGTATVTFNGTAAQTITHASAETFNNLTITGSGGTTTNVPLTLNGALTIGSSFDVSASNRKITMKGNWINNGTFVAREGEVEFSGTTAQTMSGTASTAFFDLRLNNTSGLSTGSGAYSLSNALTLTAGNFNVSATGFTMRSDATRTARIAPVTSGTVTGNFTIERFISARAAGYSDMSSPVNASTFADWDNELLLIFGYNPPNVYPSVWGYSESLWDYVPITSSTTSLTPGAGYEVWLDSDGNYTTFNATTVNTIGNPRIGNLNVSASITRVNDGWNLVGNPFASYISWDAVFASSSQISNTIMIYDETIEDYITLSTGSGIEIAPHQGFWVQATGTSPVLTFNEAHKTTASNSNFRSAEVRFTLQLASTDENALFSSNTVFEFDENANVFQDASDITFLKIAHPEAPALFSVVPGAFLRENHLPVNSNLMQVPVFCRVGKNGEYRIRPLSTEILMQEGYTCAVLYDKKTRQQFDLMQGTDYVFQSNTTDAPDRFVLLLSKSSDCDALTFEASSDVVELTQLADGVKLNIALSGDAPCSVEVLDIQGKQVAPVVSATSVSSMILPYPMASGMYLVVVKQGEKTWVQKFVRP